MWIWLLNAEFDFTVYSTSIISASNYQRSGCRWFTFDTNGWKWRNNRAICGTKSGWTILCTWWDIYRLTFFVIARNEHNPLNSFGYFNPFALAEDQSRKREIRLQKNREAARECRRKKKEYIKCLENRVAVLENQNKALIEELKSLKELYCQQKTDWWDDGSQLRHFDLHHIYI